MEKMHDMNDPKKEKEIAPGTLPPELPPAAPEILPEPEKPEPYAPSPETPIVPEPKTYPGKEDNS
jgi:hypothetical protein